MKGFAVSIPEALKTDAFNYYRAIIDAEVYWFFMQWDDENSVITLTIMDVNGDVKAQGISMIGYHNLLSGYDQLPGWQLYVETVDEEIDYTREEIDTLTVTLVIPESEKEIDAAPHMAVRFA